ncbi:MAG TPA: family 20 glycosylhydrolase, partial [Steroidobacteraceae bacterium]|nr:family 20 glycosylhydrolase [Steroidobacteraceae bacterium]
QDPKMRRARHLRAGLVTALLAVGPAAAPLSAGAAAASVPEVIPAPAAVMPRAGSFALGGATAISIPHERTAARIAAWLAGELRASHGLSLSVRARGHGEATLPAGVIALVLEPAAAGASPESYALTVVPERIVVRAGDPRGLFYGAVTLWQLATAAPRADGAVRLAAVEISDTPRFRWRGLMLDSARHFQSPGFVLRTLDWMALHKLNVLDWHLTDDQAWRLEIRRYPRLTRVGAWRVPAGRAALHDIDPATGRPRLYGGYYTQSEVRRIVAYAAERNITIVPEIDMPGHASAALVAYPRLASTQTPATAVPSDWGVYPNLFNVEESTFTFLERVLDEVMALFPGAFVHTGGDEAVKDQWRASQRIQARMRELGVPDEAALQGYFTARMARYLAAHGRRLIGWDEILEGGVPADAAVMSWRGVAGAIAAAASGHDTVLSPAPTLYLDNRQGTGPGEPPGRGTVVSLEDVYRFDPLPGALARDAQHVLGVQANLWTEHVRTEANAEYMTWPRAAALAEVAWSAPARIDWDSFRMRLASEFTRYRALGIHYADDVFAPPRVVGPYERHYSQDLKTCESKLLLNLEDDAPLAGPRAVFLVDIMDPCWLLPAVDLGKALTLTAAVGQVPFNFQIGHDIEKIHLDAPRTPAGELEVRLDGCAGAPAVTLPLAPAVANDAVTVLPPAVLKGGGVHTLCLRVAQRTLDPLWTIDWVQVAP